MTNKLKKAKKSICELSLKMKLFSEQLEYSNQDSQSADIATESLSFSSTDERDFEKYLDNIEKAKAKRMKIKNQETLDIKMKNYKQDLYTAFDDCSCKTPLLEFIKIYPEKLMKVALTITALPPTQVSVE
ncbi:MAG: hypothetical protein E7Y34_03020, partial [Mycoplasma sp.]|nr:hypothetical protein [Mycoplasma sp.]